MPTSNAKTGQPVTIRDVARAAGVSVGTVSRTLNMPATVRPATLEKVRTVIRQLGFQPDPRAQNMRRRTTLAVGFIINDITNPMHAMVFRAAEAELREHGFALHLVSTGGEPQREAEAIDTLQRGRVDGLMMTINSEQDPGCRRQLSEMRVPGVLLDRELPIDIDAVMTDHASGMRQAVDYLIGLGHRRIALITAGTDISPGRERKRGFVEAFANRRLPCPTDLIRAQQLSASFGQREASALLRSANPPTAIIAGGNQILVGVLRAVQQHGRTLGGDLSLITCDRTDLATTYPGPLTLIDRDVDAIGRTAAQLLLERMSGQSTGPSRRITLPTTLILGHSCVPPSEAPAAVPGSS
jgi:LacI family transcriptional regulator, galactose operon repressor